MTDGATVAADAAASAPSSRSDRAVRPATPRPVRPAPAHVGAGRAPVPARGTAATHRGDIPARLPLP